VVLFGSVLQFMGVTYGIPLLFLDPEYLGHVNFLSFLMVGFAMGGFIMAWNVSFYILNSYRFEFLASLVNPFVQFSLNNSLLPFSFTVCYIAAVVKFQRIEGLIPGSMILLNVLALIAGNILMVLTAGVFFSRFSQDVETSIQNWIDRITNWKIFRRFKLYKLSNKKHRLQWRIESYLRFPFNISLVRKVDFYDKKLVDRVLFLHHKSAFLFQLLSIVGLIALGSLIEYRYFRLPAAASIFLIFSVVIVFFSFIDYVFRGWQVIAIAFLIFLLNFLTQYGLVIYKHRIYGLDYSGKKIEYNNDAVNNAVDKSMITADIRRTTTILENWKNKMQRNYGESKPPMIFISTAGGGLKATYWTFHVLQQLEKRTGRKLFDHTFLLTGASGGMIGAAYFRELFYRQKTHLPVNCLSRIYLDDIGKDLLNGIGTSIVTNDIFFPWQTYTYKGFHYKKDRGYMFNLQLNENTHHMLNKLMMAYRQPEQDAVIPMMITGGTIINDQRFLFFSPQEISYLIKPYIRESKGYFDNLATDAVEYMRFFKGKQPENITFIDALRINATYPYITPAVYLPTAPQIKVMDAAIRENSGFTVSTRFYSVFKDWIDANTRGVIFISIRVDNKLKNFDPNQKETYISELLSPLGSILNNFILLQDYNSDIGLSYLENASNTGINVLNFNYDEKKKRKRASMSWHLTRLEKRDIRNAFSQENNRQMLVRLKALLR
jgi:hypothetical protein